MKIVKFKNGKYAIRKWTLGGFYFYNLTNESVGEFLGVKSNILKYCQGTFEEVKKIFLDAIDDNGTPIK